MAGCFTLNLSLALSLVVLSTFANAQPINELSIVNQQPGEWLSHGRGYDEKRFSPLKQINDSNVKKLGLVWAVDLPVKRGFQATPLFHDGVLYTTGPRGIVCAVDAHDGKVIWQYDPKSKRMADRGACCGVSNRGVAIWGDSVFVGALDGRLIALDAKTGQVQWQNMTVDPTKGHTITGAPRVVKGKVLIGFGGADMSARRGYISAYDADTGKLSWRFYTVPGNPAKPFENKAMELAANTWSGQWWKSGGGGAVWDSMSYDPDLDLLYIGVGNGFPLNQKIRSPGGGDNLYLSSIVALHPDTGEMVWYYQTTPGETWGFTATQNMILADLEMDGKKRKVIMQAPKNGFFYVLDRQTGKLISAEKFSKVNWAFSVDKKTGRPIEVPGARYNGHAAQIIPSILGAHNWAPMSYNPMTKLVYIPANIAPNTYDDMQKDSYELIPSLSNSGIKLEYLYKRVLPADAIVRQIFYGELIAWDPIKQKAKWIIKQPYVWNSGTLTTAGNLVFQGDPAGMLTVYNATTGEKLWQFDAKTALVASPISYKMEGKQYITIMAGAGGLGSQLTDILGKRNLLLTPRILTFSLDGKVALPPAKRRKLIEKPPVTIASQQQIKKGFHLYHDYCARCHGKDGRSGSQVSDLRASPKAIWDSYDHIVLRGVYLDHGMPRFDDVLTEQDVKQIKAYMIDQANKLYNKQQGAKQ